MYVTKEVAVKSNKKVIGSTKYEEFPTLEDAIEFFSKFEKEGEEPQDGKKRALDLVNAAHRVAAMNKYRASMTRPASPAVILREKLENADATKLATLNIALEALGIELGDLLKTRKPREKKEDATGGKGAAA